MGVYYKAKLSGSTEGAPIAVSAVNSTGANTIHTCSTSTGANIWDEVYLWAHSQDTDVDLTIEYGSTSAILKQRLNYNEGMVQVLPGTIGNGALVIKAFKGSTGASVFITGFVNQIR